MDKGKLGIAMCAIVMALAAGALSGCSSQSASPSVESTASTMVSAANSAAASTTTGTSTTAEPSAASLAESSTSSATSTNTSTGSVSASTPAGPLGTVANTIAQNEESLVGQYASKFRQAEYADAETGLSVTYNLFLPAGYDEVKSYPMVVFIGDSTCAGADATRSLTQGLGALVWVTDEWQAANECIVCVPTYPETILDDRNGYITTEYVELTARLIESVSGTYAVDKNRIYGTGQSMGCMTTLILASGHPDLYAGCMFVDGQWDVSTLKGLENQTFVYFAAEDDTSAFTGMSEVMAMFDADGVGYKYAQWDGAWTPDELSAATADMVAAGAHANFISWKTGTIDAGSASIGGGTPGGNGGGRPSSASSSGAGASAVPSAASDSADSSSASVSANGSIGASVASASASSASEGTAASGARGGNSGGMGSVGYHMASFDYAYNCIAVMEWLFQQSK